MTRGLLLYDAGNRCGVLLSFFLSFLISSTLDFGWVHMGYHDTGPGALSDSAAAAVTFGSICNFNEHEEKTKGLNTRMEIDFFLRQ
jgi:hypothetical protein